jgi:hypothetical protein
MEYDALKEDFDLTMAGFSPVSDHKIPFVPLSAKKISAWFNFHYKLHSIIRKPFSLFNKLQYKLRGHSPEFQYEDYLLLSKRHFDLIICHHPNALELAVKLIKGNSCKLIFNAHEIYPYEFEENIDWMDKNFKPIDSILKKYLISCEIVLSVNQQIADFYISNYGVKAVPVFNSKAFYELSALSVNKPIKLIHHGGAVARRKLEQMADAVINCNGKYELTFMLLDSTSDGYLTRLKATYGPKGIKFINPVSYHEIIPLLNEYDGGLYILPADNRNHILALPNKFFEFIQARLCLIISPNSAMKYLVEKYHVGVVAEDFSVEAMTTLLKKLSPEQIEICKQNCMEAARTLNADADIRIINTVVKEILV